MAGTNQIHEACSNESRRSTHRNPLKAIHRQTALMIKPPKIFKDLLIGQTIRSLISDLEVKTHQQLRQQTHEKHENGNETERDGQQQQRNAELWNPVRTKFIKD